MNRGKYSLDRSYRTFRSFDECSDKCGVFLSFQCHRTIEKRRTEIVGEVTMVNWSIGETMAPHRKQYLDDSLTKRHANVIHREIA